MNFNFDSDRHSDDEILPNLEQALQEFQKVNPEDYEWLVSQFGHDWKNVECKINDNPTILKTIDFAELNIPINSEDSPKKPIAEHAVSKLEYKPPVEPPQIPVEPPQIDVRSAKVHLEKCCDPKDKNNLFEFEHNGEKFYLSHFQTGKGNQLEDHFILMKVTSDKKGKKVFQDVVLVSVGVDGKQRYDDPSCEGKAPHVTPEDVCILKSGLEQLKNRYYADKARGSIKTTAPVARILNDTKEDNRDNFTESRAVKGLVNKIKTESPVLCDFLQSEDCKEDDKQSLVCRQVTIPVTFPTDHGLVQHAKRYSKNYGIQMQVITVPRNADNFTEYATKQLENIKCDKPPGNVGVIFVLEGFGHVVPMVMHFNKKGKKSALLMDVLGLHCRHNNVCINLTLALETLNVPYKICSQTRQADTFSCRVGALVTLRNALNDLKTNPAQLKNLETKEVENANYETFELPSQWGFTDQIFSKKEEVDNANVSNLRPSSSPVKMAETIKEHRHRHRETVQMDYEFTVNASIVKKYEKEHNVNLLENPPSGVTIKKVKYDDLQVVWSESIEVNTYMLRKGQKLAAKYTPPTTT